MVFGKMIFSSFYDVKCIIELININHDPKSLQIKCYDNGKRIQVSAIVALIFIISPLIMEMTLDYRGLIITTWKTSRCPINSVSRFSRSQISK